VVVAAVTVVSILMIALFHHLRQTAPRRLPAVLQYCYQQFVDYSRRQTMLHGSQRVTKFHWVRRRRRV
jgi:hypothetical protein